VTREAHVLVTRGEPDVLLVSFYNHVPEARRRAAGADVRFAGDHPAATLVGLLAARGAGGAPVGLVGPLPYDQYAVLAEGRRVVDLSRAHTRLRLRKSEDEIAALRHAAALTDASAAALLEPPMVGCTEHELVARIEYAYVSRGGMHHIHYLGVTPMAAPDRSVPAQWPSDRPVAPGDLLTFELSAAVAPEYSGQLLRTVAIDAEPTARVRELHDVAEAALAAVSERLRPGVHAEELVAAAGVIEDAGFTTVDDLVHGFGGGYLPPVIGSRSRAIRPTPDVVLEAGMTVVVQPNVATPDGRLGVQTGELLLVTDQGPERLHSFPRGLVLAS
jgi:Xaa-Pro aminopeptidase